MITVVANSRSASCRSDDLITSGSVGIPVTLELSHDFDGLSCVVVFCGSGETRDVIPVDSACVVPHECVASDGDMLRIGVYGRNAEGTIVIPTIWAGFLPILKGAEPSDIDPSQPTPDWTAQVQQMATDAYDMAEDVQARADRGEFDGEPGEPGAVYTPVVSAEGVISWSNNGELPDPEPVNIKGPAGVSPTVTVTDIPNGHRVTITDANGTRAFDVLDGTDGDDGRGIASAVLNADYTLTLTYTDGTSYTTPSLRGEPGADGYSPVASVSKSGKVATISITDKQGTTTATVSDGEDGAPGVSPTVTITDITGGHRVTVTDADGAHSFDVMDGEDYVLTQQDKADIAAMVDVPVQDVQVDGTSILDAQGVASVPVAAQNTLGVVKVSPDYGIAAGQSTSVNAGVLRTTQPTDNQIKEGNSVYRTITPTNQHKATFYGLAKAAGDATQSASSNAVGTYTDEAKRAIKRMLGIYDEWELIANVTVAEDSEQVEINTDISGQPFKLSQMLVRASLTAATTGNNSNISSSVRYQTKEGVNSGTTAGTLQYASGGAAGFFEYNVELRGGILISLCKRTPLPGTSASPTMASSSADDIVHINGFRMSQYSSTTSLIPAGSIIKIYGVRV